MGGVGEHTQPARTKQLEYQRSFSLEMIQFIPAHPTLAPISQMQKRNLREIKIMCRGNARAWILTIEKSNLRTSELAVKNQEL